MPFDLATHLGAMTRAVTSLERDGRPAKAVVASRIYPTDPDDLWDAVTSPARLRRWFLPVTGELRLGGRYQLEGNASGTITACDPPRAFEATWEFAETMSWITVALSPEGDGTRLTLEHVALLDDVFWPTYGPGAGGVGWDLGFMGLARHIAEPEVERPPEADEGWLASPEALALYRLTSEAWGRAAIADGASEADAMAAAERTRAFYAGEAPQGS